MKAQRDAARRRVRRRPRADGRPPRARAHRARRCRSRPRRRPHRWACDSGSQIPSFSWPGGAAELRTRLRAIASAAEDAGFDSIWVMDHFRQIPMFGPAWHDMLESYTTLAYLAAATERVRLGTLVTGVTYRNVGHLGKIVATLDVLSGGRAMCGLGLGWFRAEHDAYGWEFPSVDARVRPVSRTRCRCCRCSGARARPRSRAECCGCPTPPAIPGRCRSTSPCSSVGTVNGARCDSRRSTPMRATSSAMSTWSPARSPRCTRTATPLGPRSSRRRGHATLHDARRPRPRSRSTRSSSGSGPAARAPSGTPRASTPAPSPITIGRFRALADAGVQTAIVSFPDLADPDPVERFAPVVAAFR